MSKRRRRPTVTQSPRVDHALLAAEMVKAMKVPAGAVVTPYGLPAQMAPQSTTQWGAPVQGRPMGWGDPLVPFGPGAPIPPAAIDPIDPLSGRPLPRRYEYPVSANLPGSSDRVLPWTLLRKLADASIVRRCIEIRKAELIAQDWGIVVSKKAIQKAILNGTQTPGDERVNKAAIQGNPSALVDQATRQGVTVRSAEAELRDRNAPLINRATDFWMVPDPANGLTFDDWLMMMLEDHFVLDALTIFPHLNLGGGLHSLEIIDGSTIKPLIDHRGGTPQAPNPAFQQILHGFPRGEYAATSDADGEYDSNTLIYRPRYRRSNSPYGMSNVEQAIINADLYMKRIEWIRAEYTAGVIPEMYIELDVSLTPEQIVAYERVFNDMLSGQAEERHRAKIFPFGFKPHQLQNFEERYRPDYDLHLIRLIGNDFDVMPTELGFPPSGGLGGKGLSDGEENITQRKGTRPLAKWAVDTFNLISRQWLDMGPDLTFQFLGLESEDELMAQQVLESQFHNAGLTANEMRDATGKPRYNIPDADMPFIITGRDIVPLSGSFDRAQAAALAAAQGAAVDPDAANSTAAQPPKQKVPTTGTPSDQGDNSGNAFKQKAATAADFRRYAKARRVGRPRPWRDFDFGDQANDLTASLNKCASDGLWSAVDLILSEMEDSTDA